jgi:hypothetical protein
MHILWRSLHSVIRFCPARAVMLFAAPGIIPLAGANQGCVIQDLETVRKLDLDACRPEPVSVAERAAVLQSLPVDGAVTQLGSGERRKLRAVDALLGTHGRKGVYEVKVIAVPQAWTGLHGRAVLLVSLPALRLLGSEELQALVAHEIGHEYVWQQYADAKTRRDAKRVRELELICDAIAVLTLRNLGVPPHQLESASEKVFLYNREHFGQALNAGSYPSPRERRQLIKKLSVCCLGNRDCTPRSANEQLFLRLYNLADAPHTNIALALAPGAGEVREWPHV